VTSEQFMVMIRSPCCEATWLNGTSKVFKWEVARIWLLSFVWRQPRVSVRAVKNTKLGR